ncbi:MAG: hypothetical protein ACI9JY_003300 [Saprospiraceae bacterium]|jgi:hypothetical protein
MKNLLFLTLVIFSMSLTSCGINLEALLDELSQPPPSSDSSSTPNSTPSNTGTAPGTPLPPPTKNGGATSRSDGNDAMTDFYKKIKLSDTQITQFEGIVKEYKKKNNAAKLKYKGNQIALNKELKNLQNAEFAAFKGMMSPYQFSLFEKELKAQSKSGAKGSVSG